MRLKKSFATKTLILLLSLLILVCGAGIIVLNFGPTPITTAFSKKAAKHKNAKQNKAQHNKGIESTDSTTETATDSAVTEEKELVKELSGKKIRLNGQVTELYKFKGKFKVNGIKKTFKTIKGKKLKNKYFVHHNKIYHAGKTGNMDKGWIKKKDDYYFFDRKSGVMFEGKKKDHVNFSQYGTVKDNSVDKERASSYVKASSMAKSITNYNESDADKIYKCFKYIEKCGYNQYRKYKEVEGNPNWDVIFANDIFDHELGCCVSESCAFAYLVKECGIKNVSICCDTSHCWIDIAGKLYDPLFAESRDFSQNYAAAYTDYRSNPAVKVTFK